MHTSFKLAPGGISFPETEDHYELFVKWSSVLSVGRRPWGVLLFKVDGEDVEISSPNPAETYAQIVREMGGEPC